MARRLSLAVCSCLAMAVVLAIGASFAWAEQMPPAADLLAPAVAQALAHDHRAIAQWSADTLGQVCAALAAQSKQADAGAACVDWVTATDQYKSATVDQLAAIVPFIGLAGDAALGARQRLSEHIQTTSLANAEGARSVSPQAWQTFARSLGKGLSDTDRTAWVTQIRAAYVDDAGALTALKLGEVRSVAGALKSLGDAQFYAAVVNWMEGTTTWQSASAGNLASLVESLSAAGDAGRTARGHLAAYVGTKYLADAASVRSAGVQTVKDLADRLSKDLSAETRASWAAKVRAAYVDDAAALSALRLGDIQTVVWALKSLGDAQSDAAVVKWMEGTTAWQSLSAVDMASLAANLLWAGDAGRTARGQLAAYVETKYFADAASVRSAGTQAIRDLTTRLSKDLSPETRASWAAKVRAAYVDDPDLVLGMPVSQLDNLCWTLALLGDGHGPYLAATFVSRTNGWRSWDRPEDLLCLLRLLTGSGATVKAARLTMADHLATMYLKDAEVTRRAGMDFWRSVINQVGKDLSQESRQTWQDCLEVAFVGVGGSVTAMSANEFRGLADSVSRLNPKEASRLALTWLGDRSTWVKTSASDLIWFALIAAREAPKDVAPLCDNLEQVWVAADAKAPLGLGRIWDLLTFWRYEDKADRAKAWVMRAYGARLGTEESRQTIDLESLGWISGLLTRAGLTTQGTAYPAYAAALARFAQDGTLDKKGNPWALAGALCAPETRQVLCRELVDAQGCPRLEVVKVLTEAYMQANEYVPWREAVDQGLAEAGGGDAKAAWLLARAYTESALSSPRALLRGQKWLEEALAAAGSPSLRLQALQELVRGYAGIGKYEEALKRLDDSAGQFLGTELAQRIADLRLEVQDAQTNSDWAVRQNRVRAAALHVEELKRRLEAARDRGDAEAVNRYQKLLGGSR